MQLVTSGIALLSTCNLTDLESNRSSPAIGELERSSTSYKEATRAGYVLQAPAVPSLVDHLIATQTTHPLNMQFSTLLAVVATFTTAVLASPAGVVTRDAAALAYYPVNIENGRTSASEGSPDGLYVYHNETHAAYHGAPTTAAIGSRSLARSVIRSPSQRRSCSLYTTSLIQPRRQCQL